MVVEEAFLPTLKTLLNAPSSSPLAEVNVNNVAELLVQLTNTKLLTVNQNQSEISQVKQYIIVIFLCFVYLCFHDYNKSECHDKKSKFSCKKHSILRPNQLLKLNIFDLK